MSDLNEGYMQNETRTCWQFELF